MSPIILQSFYLTVCFCLWVARFSPQQLLFIHLLLPWQNYIRHRCQASSRQMFTRSMILGIRSRLVPAIAEASYNLPERLSVWK